jgi:cytidylate kinase
VVIAIDGPGGVGKSTVARAVAHRLGLAYLDTGSTYRAATLIVLRSSIDPSDEEAIVTELAAHEIDYGHDGVEVDGITVASEVRTDRVTSLVSAVSAHPRVRSLIVDVQRDWVHRHGDAAVVEGRDIGTVVFPEAPVKIYLTARPEVRAARRAGDAEAAHATVAEIAATLAERDHADSTREASPLRPAHDAETVDTSDIDVDEVVDRILELVSEAGLDPTQ